MAKRTSSAYSTDNAFMSAASSASDRCPWRLRAADLLDAIGAVEGIRRPEVDRISAAYGYSASGEAAREHRSPRGDLGRRVHGHKVFDFLLRRIDLFNLRDRAAPSGMLLFGYPGNGKEFLGQKIAESVFGEFVKVSSAELNSVDDVKAVWQQVSRRVADGSVRRARRTDFSESRWRVRPARRVKRSLPGSKRGRSKMPHTAASGSC